MKPSAALIMFFACLSPSFGSDAAVKLAPSSTHTIIGESFALEAVITKKAGESVENIILPSAANIQFSLASHKKGAQSDTARFELRFFDLGEVEVPSPEFVISSAVVKGEPFTVFVKGRLAEGVGEIKKLRGQRRGAFPKLLALALLFALIAALAVYYLLRHKKAPVAAAKQISPEEWYASALDAIDRKAPVNELLDALSDTFRIYLEKKRALPAIFLDTSEIDREMKKRGFGTEERLKALTFLRSCDLAKFAGRNFEEKEVDKLFRDARSFAGMGERQT